ncbi:hypothetical protein MSPP1_002471 [Malassezia sp. CBS 17886]|nr:hypothetical protein MSPP1_002471 [Malassezia sp. CBS 17886]
MAADRTPAQDTPVDRTAHLDALEESINRRIDTDVDTILESYKDILNLSRIGNKDHFDVNREAFQLETRADTIVRAAQSLCLLSDSLKLSMLLSQSQAPDLHASDAEALVASAAEDKRRCSEFLARHWLEGATTGQSDDV